MNYLSTIFGDVSVTISPHMHSAIIRVSAFPDKSIFVRLLPFCTDNDADDDDDDGDDVGWLVDCYAVCACQS